MTTIYSTPEEYRLLVGARYLDASDRLLNGMRAVHQENPFHFLVNRLQRASAQVVDPDKELFHRAKDNRRLRAPAVRIGVMIILLGQQHPALPQELYDVLIGIENVAPDKIRQTGLVCEAPMIIDRR